MKKIQFIVEKHSDGYIAYPLGVQGVVIGEGDTSEEALVDAKSALNFHVETFGLGVLDTDSPVLEVSVVETVI
jgi:predicted RNase H-like HicB family nuclease